MIAIEFQLDQDRAREALVYFAHKFPRGIDKLVACKLIFLADKHHLVRYGRTITGDQYAAMPHGPVPSRILDQLDMLSADPGDIPALASALKVDTKTFTQPHIVATRPPNKDFLSGSDLEALEDTWERHGAMSVTALMMLTHAMVAYDRAWKSRGKKHSLRMAFEDFFEDEPDAIAGAMEEAIENTLLRKAFSGR